MKKLSLIILFAIGAFACGAQVMSYHHKPLSKEGCKVAYYVTSHNGQMAITVEVSSSDGVAFLNNPIMMLRFDNDTVLKIDGSYLGIAPTSSSGGGYVIGNYVSSSSDPGKSRAIFIIPKEDVELFNNQKIIKVRLSTVPFAHEHTFDIEYDHLARKLYNAFLKDNQREDDF